jgi:hypothetical protein
MEHTMAYLNGAFASKQGIKKKYMQLMEHKFLAELDGYL